MSLLHPYTHILDFWFGLILLRILIFWNIPCRKCSIFDQSFFFLHLCFFPFSYISHNHFSHAKAFVGTCKLLIKRQVKCHADEWTCVMWLDDNKKVQFLLLFIKARKQCITCLILFWVNCPPSLPWHTHTHTYSHKNPVKYACKALAARIYFRFLQFQFFFPTYFYH